MSDDLRRLRNRLAICEITQKHWMTWKPEIEETRFLQLLEKTRRDLEQLRKDRDTIPKRLAKYDAEIQLLKTRISLEENGRNIARLLKLKGTIDELRT